MFPVYSSPRFIVVGLANGGLVVFNINFNRWREEIQHQQPPRNDHDRKLREVEGREEQPQISPSTENVSVPTERKNPEPEVTESQPTPEGTDAVTDSSSST